MIDFYTRRIADDKSIIVKPNWIIKVESTAKCCTGNEGVISSFWRVRHIDYNYFFSA